MTRSCVVAEPFAEMNTGLAPQIKPGVGPRQVKLTVPEKPSFEVTVQVALADRRGGPWVVLLAALDRPPTTPSFRRCST